MAEWFVTDGRIDRSAFASWDHVDAFRQSEENNWDQMAGEDLSRGARTAVERTKGVLVQARSTLFRMRQNGTGFQNGLEHLTTLFETPTGGGVATSGLRGSRFHDIRRSSSLSAAVFDLAFRRGVVSLGDARDPEDILGGFWDVAPGLLKTADLAQFLARERSNTRRTLRDEVERLRVSDRDRLQEWEDKLQEGRAAYVGWARRRSTRWARHTRTWEERHLSSEARIRSVEDSYREKMGLAAPVAYWKTKAGQHKKAEGWARLWVLLFFPIALGGLVAAFCLTGIYLIDQATAPRVDGAEAFPSAVFIVASAGLASCAGLVFWVGRLLTKLYLSQHHLRQDADERATMTETYLALIENGAASTEDRQVILNALFRNTPDGIVKEDGGLDPSIAAALGKYLAKA